MKYYTLSQDFLQYGNADKTILAIDGIHIEIDAPINSPESYFNRKGFYSQNVLGVVDAQKRFRFLSNHVGLAHNSRVLRISPTLINNINFLDDGYHLIGDKAYRGYSNILIPGVTENATIENYTENLTNQIIRVENAFRLFKRKFKRF